MCSNMQSGCLCGQNAGMSLQVSQEMPRLIMSEILYSSLRVTSKDTERFSHSQVGWKLPRGLSIYTIRVKYQQNSY